MGNGREEEGGQGDDRQKGQRELSGVSSLRGQGSAVPSDLCPWGEHADPMCMFLKG